MEWQQLRVRVDAPLDLVAVATVAVVALVGLLTGLPAVVGSSLRFVLGVLFITFAPGYALVSLLVPAKTVQLGDDESVSVGVVERLVLSVGLSLVLVPLVGIGLNYTAWGVTSGSLLVGIGSVTVLLSGLAVGRRLSVAPTRRFGFGPSALRTTIRNWIVVPGRTRETILNVVIVLGLVLAVAGVGLAVATAENGERYTELYLLTEDPATGQLAADDYPDELTVGEPTEVHVGITNQERESVTYTVVVQLQRIDQANGDAMVTERVELDSFEATVAHGETWERPHEVEPTVEGESLRLTYLLYVGDPPLDPTAESAHRSVHLWVDATGADEPS